MIGFFEAKKEKQGDELITEAKKLGVATDDIFEGAIVNARVFSAVEIKEAVLQERVRRAKEANYARRMWVVALASAVTSIISAIAAWAAILTNK